MRLVSREFNTTEILSAKQWIELGFTEFMVLNIQRELVAVTKQLQVFNAFTVEVSYNIYQAHLQVSIGDNLIFSNAYPLYDLPDGSTIKDLTSAIEDIVLKALAKKVQDKHFIDESTGLMDIAEVD
jgi:hypothetical protein